MPHTHSYKLLYSHRTLSQLALTGTRRSHWINSLREAGGTAPLPLHVTWPEPQSTVGQVNLPEASVEHCARAQKRPDHGEPTSIDLVCVEPNSNPVVDS
ncbi:hypothetical protein QYF36_015949 [Acer negundo]|nr:hypothetical protein QYF36_015949 [Acer negundo]